MNLKPIHLLLLLALMLLIVSCGGATEPTSDIDAMVEARVKEAIAALSTPTPTATPTPAVTPAPTSIERASGAKGESTNNWDELDSSMKEELIVLASNRDAWFLSSDITTEALEGLYGSSSLICVRETSLREYKEAVYEWIRPLLLESLEIDLKDAQEAHRYYEVVFWSSPWAYVEQTWKLGEKIIIGPERQLYVLESGAWRYHDC